MPGTTWANEMNLCINHAPDAGSITFPILTILICSPSRYHCATAAPCTSLTLHYGKQTQSLAFLSLEWWILCTINTFCVSGDCNTYLVSRIHYRKHSHRHTARRNSSWWNSVRKKRMLQWPVSTCCSTPLIFVINYWLFSFRIPIALEK